MEYETVYIKDEISKCEDIDDLREKIFPMIKTQQEQWKNKINEIVIGSSLTKSKFSQLCGVSRVTVNKWCNGSIPKNRETFLRIGMAAGYDREKMNQLLQRYGRYPALYVKSLEDCVCIYVLQDCVGPEAVEKYNYILKKIKSVIVRDESVQGDNIQTEEFDEKLSEVSSQDELEKFISDNVAVFSTAYNEFYSYVLTTIEMNNYMYSGSVYELAEGQGWSSSLRQCVSAIRQRKWYPTRNKIISLGLHLSMDHEQVDKMLKLAHMEPLCAKNIFESIIMFILDDASLNDILDSKSEEYDPDELCRYARAVLKELDLSETGSFISELSEMDEDEL